MLKRHMLVKTKFFNNQKILRKRSNPWKLTSHRSRRTFQLQRGPEEQQRVREMSWLKTSALTGLKELSPKLLPLKVNLKRSKPRWRC